MHRSAFVRAGIVGTALILALPGTSVHAGQVFSFAKITNNNPEDLSGQVSVLVLTPSDATELAQYGYAGGISANQVVFVFFNNVGITSSVTQVYWQDGEDTTPATPSALSTFVDRVNNGVNYPNAVGTGTLPGGNSLVPAFDDTFQIAPNTPHPLNGIDASGDWLSVRFNATTNATAVIAAMNNWAYDGLQPVANRWSIVNPSLATLRIGFHAQTIGQGEGSDAYVNIPNATPPVHAPEPSTLAMGALGLLACGLIARRGRRTQAAGG